ncbi:MAG TPA: alpha/beta hydrolase [Gaiellaceae bacterium]
MTSIRERPVETRGVRFALLEAGEEDAPLALCLHGFPDSAWSWRHVLPALAEGGLRAVAPFMRGYAPTGPAPDGRYGVSDLAADVVALDEALGGSGKTILVGHDWGAAAVFGALDLNPGRWGSAVAISVPPAGGYSIDAVSLGQMRRSWYSYLFQLPDFDVAEALVAADDLAFVDSLWADWSPGYDGAEDAERAKAALRPPGCLRAALAYYREAPTVVRTPEERAASQAWWQALAVPFLYVHGARDGCIGLDAVEQVREHFPPKADVAILEEAGHFVQLEQPEELSRLVMDFAAR